MDAALAIQLVIDAVILGGFVTVCVITGSIWWIAATVVAFGVACLGLT